MAAPVAHERSQAKGWIRAATEAYATAMAEQHGIWAASAAPWGNVGSLAHWARPGIKPISSGTLCWVPNTLSHNGNSPITTLDFNSC